MYSQSEIDKGAIAALDTTKRSIDSLMVILDVNDRDAVWLSIIAIACNLHSEHKEFMQKFGVFLEFISNPITKEITQILFAPIYDIINKGK